MIKTQAEANQVKDLAQEVADLTAQVEKLQKTRDGVYVSTKKKIDQVSQEVGKIVGEANRLLDKFAHEARTQADLANAELIEIISAKKRRLDALGGLISTMTEKVVYNPDIGGCTPSLRTSR